MGKTSGKGAAKRYARLASELLKFCVPLAGDSMAGESPNLQHLLKKGADHKKLSVLFVKMAGTKAFAAEDKD